MNDNIKTKKTKKNQESLSLSEAEQFLRKIEEWHSVSHLDRDTIIKWAEFLKNKES